MTDLTVRPVEAEGRPAFLGLRFPLAPLGYQIEELLVSGMAASFEPGGSGAPFCTRLVVVRPSDPARKVGTALVEWMNVSGGIEAAPAWMNLHTGLLRSGAVYVGVSAQALAIDGGSDLLGQRRSPGLRDSDPARYGALRHPGDPWSYDIFAAAGAAIRSGQVLGAEPDLVLACGHSQSAHRLVTFVNVIDGHRPVFDGFLVLGRGAAAAPLGPEKLRTIASGTPVPLAPAGRVPVLCVQSETDVVLLGSARSRAPDGPSLRTWEIAGAAHADTYQLLASSTDDGRRPPGELAAAIEPTDEPFGVRCAKPINSGLQQHYAWIAAAGALARWAAGGDPPPAAPPLDLAEDALAVDDLGIATGGARSPFVDAPTSVLSGLGQEGESFGRLFGTTTILDRDRLRRMYGDEAGFATRCDSALGAAVDGGFMVEADVAEAAGVAVEQWRKRA